jgi:tetratricopeptide (TPR) repeat protein
MQRSLKSYLLVGMGIASLGAFLIHRASVESTPKFSPVSEQVAELSSVPAMALATPPELNPAAMPMSTMSSLQPPEMMAVEAGENLDFEPLANAMASPVNELVETAADVTLDSDMQSNEFSPEIADSSNDFVSEQAVGLEAGIETAGIETTGIDSQASVDFEMVEDQQPEAFELVDNSPEIQTEETDTSEIETPASDEVVDGFEFAATSTDSAIESDETAELPSALQRLKGSWKKNPYLTDETPAITNVSGVPSTEKSIIVRNDKTSEQMPVEQNDLTETMENEITENTALDFHQFASDVTPSQDQAAPMTEMPESMPSTTLPQPPTPITSAPAMVSGNDLVTPLQMPLSDSAAQQAVHRIEYGKTLSRRNATFAARQEFVAALRIIAQEHDAKSGGSEFSKALHSAMVAMKESKDFMINDGEIAFDVSRIVEAHLSDVVSTDQARGMTSTQALQLYLQRAESLLDQAGGRNVVSSEALFCLGKLHSLLSQNSKMPENLDTANAIVFFRAALKSNPNHHQSANELGVLMTRAGNLAKAKQLFKQSLLAQQSTHVWGNLAKVHQRMGEQEFAQLANMESQMVGDSRLAANSSIRWMSNAEFKAESPTEFFDRKQQPAVQGMPLGVAPSMVAEKPQPKTERVATKPGATTPPKDERKPFSERLKDLF